MKEYKKLDKVSNYDQEAAEEYAAAHNEAAMLMKRVAELQHLIGDNKELGRYVWRTAGGEMIAIHKISDEHFTNIINHMHDQGRTLSREMQAEAKKRGISTLGDPWTALPAPFEEMPEEFYDEN